MNEENPILTILRGLPGAGKSTEAQKLGCLVIEPNDMYARRGGKYDFTPGDAYNAMQLSLSLLHTAMGARVDVAIAEVLPLRREVGMYTNIAERAGYTVKVIDLDIDVETSKKRNIHNVKHEDIERMAAQFEPWSAA